MLNYIVYSAAFLALATGSYTDLKKREVPDWLSYSLMAFALGFRLLYSIITSEWTELFAGILGFLAFLLIGVIMYYTGQWGGGDAKILMGLGALIGLKAILNPLPTLALFFMNILLFGSLYGLIYTLWLAYVNRKKFLKQYRLESQKTRNLKILVFVLTLLVLLSLLLIKDTLLRIIILFFTIFIPSLFYVWLLLKTMEKSVLIKRLPVEKLTEGDWIYKDIIIDGKRICGPKDLGIEKEQIAQLHQYKANGKIKTVLVKEGIPFVPGFLIALISTLLLGDWITSLLIWT